MRLEVYVPNQAEADILDYLMHISNKKTGQRLFSLSRTFEVTYVPGYEEHVARVFFKLMTQSQHCNLEFRSGHHWFVLHYDGRFETSPNPSESLIHILLHAAFILYDRLPV